MEPKRGAGDGDAGWLEVVLLIVSVMGALAVVVMIVGVSLPNGLIVRLRCDGGDAERDLCSARGRSAATEAPALDGKVAAGGAF
jgi:hypothetical protein